jgi:hypothetical protein
MSKNKNSIKILFVTSKVSLAEKLLGDIKEIE